MSANENITGVSLYINPERQLSVLNKTLPSVKRAGSLYDPAITGDFVGKARFASKAAGIELITREIRSSKDVPEILKKMKGEIDAFWMLPDLTVVTPETIEFLLLFSIENRIPVITFSDKYLEMGALLSISIDAVDIGKQAWEITEMVLSGEDVRKIPRVDARKAEVTLNQRAAKKLGIIIDKEIIKGVKVVNKE